MDPEVTAAHCSSPTLQEVDWEAELAVVIGKKGKHIKATDAMAHVAGFTVAHDVSARDWQTTRNGKQWLLGKTFDTFCPLGPALSQWGEDLCLHPVMLSATAQNVWVCKSHLPCHSLGSASW
ncbi:PREDICTED: fumarylacetoacetate hydrolase domain-containing protein 2-like [Cercocebus atys]|uniref:fumarylacetoacetate hydrolase domain-containing protein 2-like n=1 Tax=Cercocebus atys TaxID=9531 RepID=UPI0005F4E415|nr:PREDICTED: fumarylacetoacetate hydrolase domain-containing protein 2-like [Cercocebus atys]